MLNYPMRAHSKCGQYLIEFSIGDGPCPVDRDHFVLTSRPGTPILLYNQIGRGSDINNLFEGDIIRDDEGVEYIVVYFRGLVCQNIETKKYSEFPGKFKVVSNIYKRGGKLKRAVPHKFTCEGITFTLQEVYGIHEDKLIVNAESKMFEPENVRQYSGLRSKTRKMLFFGDDGLKLVEGRLSVEREGKILSIVDKEYVIN